MNARSSECPELDRFLGRLDTVGALGEDDHDWARHREGCAACRAAWSAELELRRHFSAQPRPALAADFGARLRLRLAAEPRPRAAGYRSWALRFYWLGAALASFLILGHVDWPEPLSSGPWLATILLTFGVPAVVLVRRFGLDPLELVLQIAEARYVDGPT